MNFLLDQFKSFFTKLNEKGIPTPMLRDPVTKQPSVSLTLLFISSLYVQLSLINRFAQFFKGVDADNSLQFFLVCAGLYFGRTLSKKIATQPENEKGEKK